MLFRSELELDPSRVYDSFVAMVAGEQALPEDRRIQTVAIVTPNHLHHEIACLFLDAGIHVICDKPLTTTLADAEDLCRRASETGLIFAVTHNYTGYPMIKEARARVAAGELGPLRKIVVEIAVNDDFLEKTIDALTHIARTGTEGSIGDGKIFVLDLASATRIRTGEAGETAL